VDLVGDDPHAELVGQRGEGGELVAGVDGARGVLRVAQQVCRPLAACGRVPERGAQGFGVEASVTGERRVDGATADGVEEAVEGVVRGGGDDDRPALVA